MIHLKIAQEVASGVSVFCATCSHYWRGKERGESCGMECGSPLGGMSFPHYHGLGSFTITDSTRFCFMCGATPHPEGGVRVEGHERIFAVCALHRGHLRDYQVVGAAPERVGMQVGPPGRLVAVERLTLRKRTLLEEMAENDLVLAEKCGEDPGTPSG